ncbi:MAG: L,D-transpeptidase family protein [Gemmatimonadetes bacterium]|nr:L,D-transpeptidase family protein [Gemmatimonadota bacterium]NNF37141.1 L,D-transpeptidase family protein [Gemmatimonadota bacterium]
MNIQRRAARLLVPRTVGFGLIATLFASTPVVGQGFDADLLRNRVEAYQASAAFQASGETLRATQALPAFYLARGFEPVWVGADGGWTLEADRARVLLAGAADHGLEPAAYHRDALARLSELMRGGSATVLDRMDAEILLSDGLLLYGSHLLLGRVDPTRVEPEWIANRREAALDTLLAVALAGGRGVRGFAEAAAPQQPEYRRLVRALRDLRRTAASGGWGTLAGGVALRPDSTDARIPDLRRRLARSPEPAEREQASSGGMDNPVYDTALAEAVRSFQRRHGLADDGVVGDRTLAALNVSVEQHIVQVEVNLERWRWLPADLGRRHIRVNAAAFTTQVWDADTVAFTLRSIVGRQYRSTPSFNGSMRYLVLAPYWHVPPTIAAVDKLPLIKADPGYVAASRMTLFSTATNTAVDPFSVDWSGVTGAEFNRRFRLRQEPGPSNALGNVKFMFPNRHNVYLHDTPQRDLFSRTARDFSSGCIRVENALDLAEFLLADQPGWTAQRIRDVVAGGVERSVNLTAPLPVYLLYFTAFVAADGTLHFRDDIYSRDGAVLRALNGTHQRP